MIDRTIWSIEVGTGQLLMRLASILSSIVCQSGVVVEGVQRRSEQAVTDSLDARCAEDGGCAPFRPEASAIGVPNS